MKYKLDFDAYKDTAIEAIAEGQVLLKNEGEVLPIIVVNLDNVRVGGVEILKYLVERECDKPPRRVPVGVGGIGGEFAEIGFNPAYCVVAEYVSSCHIDP